MAPRLKRFKASGFSLHLVYVFLDDVGLCNNRIKSRVRKGGHNVPVEDVARRYHRSMANFRKVYLPMADTWQILYNGLKRPVEVAVGEDGKTKVIDDEYYNRFMEISR